MNAWFKPEEGESLTADEAGETDWLLAVVQGDAVRMMAVVARGFSAHVLESLAEHPRATEAMLSELAKHSSVAVRVAVAENGNAPLETLLRLACDEDIDLRFRMAENHNLPLCVLDMLAEDANPYVGFRAQKTIQRLTQHCEIKPFIANTQRRRALI
jgi:hypothetical protein